MHVCMQALVWGTALQLVQYKAVHAVQEAYLAGVNLVQCGCEDVPGRLQLIIADEQPLVTWAM